MLMPDKHSLINPLLSAINRQIQTKTPAVKLCDELEGKIISINIKNTSSQYLFAHNKKKKKKKWD